ncbi:MAG: NAD-dependent epimerase/dehydratase family protein [Saprospiraceae bacterium]
MRILITGANGFIGSNLAAALLKQKHKVVGLVRKTSDLKYLKDLPVQLVYGDILDRASIYHAARGCDILVHTAGAVTDWGDIDYFTKLNVEGLKNVAQAAADYEIKRLVHISTVAIYGFNVKDAKETDPTPPSQVRYSQTKLLGVQWLNDFATKTGMEIVKINPGNVFGPGDDKFIKPYLDIISKNGFVFVNKGESLTCPTYIDNLVHGIALACFQPNISGETFNITDGLEITWKEFTDAFYIALGKKPISRSISHGLLHTIANGMEKFYTLFQIKKSPLLTRYRIDNAGKDYHFSIEHAREVLGYAPVVDFETSIKNTVDWYKKETKR